MFIKSTNYTAKTMLAFKSTCPHKNNESGVHKDSLSRFILSVEPENIDLNPNVAMKQAVEAAYNGVNGRHASEAVDGFIDVSVQHHYVSSKHLPDNGYL